MISLHPFDRKDVARVAHISVLPEQEVFSGNIKTAMAKPPETVDIYEIRHADKAIGLFQIDRNYHSSFDFAQADDLGLRGFLIDHAMQGQGLGTKAMALVGPYIAKRYPDKRKLWLTVNIINPVAVATYRKTGFIESGDILPPRLAGPQLVMFYELSK